MWLIQPKVKGVELLIGEFESNGPTDGFMSVTIALMFFFTVYILELIGNGIWFRPSIRNFLGDYAYPVCDIPDLSLIIILRPVDCYDFLDWLCLFSRPIESDQRSQTTAYESLLPNHR